MRRPPALIGIIAVLAVLALVKVTLFRGDSPRGGGNTAAGGGSAAALSVDAVVLTPERLADRVSAVGTVLSSEAVDIRSDIAGRVASILFDEGTRVAKGQVLVKIDDAELRAQLARAEARLAIARDEADRQKQLFEQTLTSEREYKNTVNELNAFRAELDLIRAQLAKTDLRAPFGGVVGLRLVSEGSYVSPATLMTTLKDLSTVKVDFSVPERHAGRVAPGDKIDFRTQGSPRVFSATVYALEPGIDEATRTRRIRARAPNSDGALIPGAFADVSVPLAEREALVIPAYAVIPELKGHRVFVLSSGVAESRSIEIGTRTDERVEVVSGLAAGDTVITSALLQLKPGMPVRLTSLD